jgi:hypothetical protein
VKTSQAFSIDRNFLRNLSTAAPSNEKQRQSDGAISCICDAAAVSGVTVAVGA